MKQDQKVIKVPVKQRLSHFTPALEYEITKEEDINLTKAKAFEYLELKTFQGERSVRESHVQFLFDEYAAGRFLWHNVNLATAKLGNDLYRINGQHTCWMRVNIPDKDEPVDAYCMLREYKVASEDQLRNLYSAFDRGAPRTVGHISKVLLIGSNAARDIPVSLLNRLVAGFRIFFSEDWRSVNANPNDLTGIIQANYSEMFNIVGRFLQIHYEESVSCRRAAVLASMFATFSKNVKASEEFWVPVWSNIGHESKSDARWRLRQFIDFHPQTIKGSGKGVPISAEELYRACINTWNRWRSGEEVDSVRSTNKRLKAKA